jgi:uncharacterized phage protein gp47/JayE
MQLDGNGLVIDTLLEILADLETRVRDALGDEIETGSSSPLGQILGILSNDLRLLQEAIAAAYSANSRASASGVNLDRIGALTGSERRPATPSRAIVTVTTSSPVNLPPGALVIAVSGQPERTFENEETIAQGIEPSGLPHSFISQDLGPIEAPATTLTVIPVPVVGVDAVNNVADATLGQDVETDTAFRARQEQELSRPASATVDGILVDVLDAVLDSNGERLIQDARVFENTTDVTNGDGLPPHSIEVVIFDGASPVADDTEVGQAVWDSKPGGIQAYGLVSTTAVDSRGDDRPSAFSRATPIRLLIEMDLSVGPAWTTGAESTESRIKTALITYWADRQRIGQDLIRSQLYDPIWDAVIKDDEVIDIVDLKASIHPAAPAAANVPIDVREIGTLADVDITINEA